MLKMPRPARPRTTLSRRIKAGNGEIVFTTEMMHNRADVEAALSKLVAALRGGRFEYVYFPDN